MAPLVESSRNIDTQHDDIIPQHDAQLDYYGRKLATASSDRTIKIFDLEGENQKLTETLRGHEGPVWQVAWAHPKFGTILASASYDSRVIIWKEDPANQGWSKIKEHTLHTASVNGVAWSSYELGPILACGSGDGKVSVLAFNNDGTWAASIFDAHALGVNAVSWQPALMPGSLLAPQTQASSAHSTAASPPSLHHIKRFASAGCDNAIRLWTWSEERNEWAEDQVLQGHHDWVRDVAFAPNIGLPRTYMASAGQDKQVLIWMQDSPTSEWTYKSLSKTPFKDIVWRVSWSLSGNILAVSCGDGQVTLWKETTTGDWENVSEIES